MRLNKVRPEVSCIIPTHGRPELLRESIASILRQSTEFSFELVVSDDERSPHTKQIVLDAAARTSIPIVYVSCLGNGGASASRNYAASTARGEYLAFLDDDDLWHETFLDKCRKAIAAADVVMAITWLEVLRLDGSRAPFFCIKPGLTPDQVGAVNAGLTGSNFMIRKKEFEELGGFDPDLKTSNDKDFMLRFLLAPYKYAVVPECLATQRRHGGPQLTNTDERRLLGYEAYLRKHRLVLTAEGKRYLRRRIHRGRMRLSTTRTKRLMHTAGWLSNLSLLTIGQRVRDRKKRKS